VSSPSASYRQKREIRVREVPEMEFCLVYVPADAQIYRLNPSAWFVFRMCEDRTEAQIARAYHAAMKPVLSLRESGAEVRNGIERLIRMRIIEEVHGGSETKSPTRENGRCARNTTERTSRKS
jgi:hypothetical protein